MGKVWDNSQAVGNAPFLFLRKRQPARRRLTRTTKGLTQPKPPVDVLFAVKLCGLICVRTREGGADAPDSRVAANARCLPGRLAIQQTTTVSALMPIIPLRHAERSLRLQRQRCQFAVHHSRSGDGRSRQAASSLKSRAPERSAATFACCAATPPFRETRAVAKSATCATLWPAA